jgi:hypothetical protein
MAGTVPVNRPHRWLMACGIVAGGAILLLILVAATSFVFLKPKRQAASYEMAGAEKAMAPAGMAMESAPMAGAAGAPAPAEARDAGGGPLTSVAQAAEARNEIIYTAQMTIEVDDVDAAATKVDGIYKAVGGKLGGGDEVTSPTGEKTTTITIRIPSAKFHDVVKELRALGDVRSLNIKADDVTRQMVDLEARLKNLRREEEVVAELFQRQGKITDVLQVEQELSRVRGEIEQAQGQWSYLRDSVAYSTVTVTIQTRPSKVEQKLRGWSAGYHVVNAWHALIRVVRAIITALIYVLIVVGPFVVAALVIWWAIRAGRRAKTPPSAGV